MKDGRSSKKRVPYTAETRARMSEAQLGKKRGPLTAEVRAKMSAAQLGKKRGPYRTKTGVKIMPESKANRWLNLDVISLTLTELALAYHYCSSKADLLGSPAHSLRTIAVMSEIQRREALMLLLVKGCPPMKPKTDE